MPSTCSFSSMHIKFGTFLPQTAGNHFDSTIPKRCPGPSGRQKEPVQKTQKYHNKIIGTLYELLSPYTMYPSHSEYVQVVKALIVKYPFSRDAHGNGYHTWHSQLKRKFKAEWAPLVNNEEVRQLRSSKSTDHSTSSCPKQRKPSLDSCLIGEDVEAHVKVLQDQYKKLHCNTNLVKDCTMKTHVWRRREVMEGMSTEDLLKRYPFLRTSADLCDEIDALCPSPVGICRRFSENFTPVLPNVLKLVKNCDLKRLYLEARGDALAEDITGIDFMGGLLLLPSIFKEKIENVVMFGKNNPSTPYPTIQLKDKDWKIALSKRCQCVISVDGLEVCSCTTLDEACIATFCMYYVFNMAYPASLKKTLSILQRHVANIVENGDTPLPVSVTQVVNLLH